MTLSSAPIRKLGGPAGPPVSVGTALPRLPVPHRGSRALALLLGSLVAVPAPAAGDDTPRHWGRDRLVDIEHVRIELSVDLAAGTIEGNAQLTVKGLHADTRRAELMADGFHLVAVTADGRPAEHDYDGKVLGITLDPPLQLGDERVLRVDYSARPRNGLYFVGKDRHDPRLLQVWSQGEEEENHSWFPIFDDPSERVTSETVITAPALYTVVSNGALVDVTPAGGATRTWHHRMDFPHAPYLVSFAAADFAVRHDTWDSIPIDSYAPRERAADMDRSYARSADIVRTLSELTGLRYPYPAYRQVAVSEFIYGGMENITATTLTDEMLHDARAHSDWPSESLLAHEAAHQWFGDYVTCRDWSDTWLNEGFATYYAALTVGALEGEDRMVSEIDGMHQGALDADKAELRPIVTNKYRSPDELFDGHAYAKGGSVLHALRRELGDAPYHAAILAWLQRHAAQAVDTHQLVATIEDVTGRDVSRFFDQWIYGAGEPFLQASWKYEDGDCAVTVDQRQEKGPQMDVFDVPLDVELLFEDASPQRYEVRSKERNETWHFASAGRPKAVVVDPDGWLLRKLEQDRGQDEALWVARHAPELMARIEAVRDLKDDAGTPDVLAGLRDLATHDAHWPLRRAAVDALSGAHVGEAEEALVAILRHEPDSRVRRMAAPALQSYDDARSARALEDALGSDASYAVRADAARALGHLRQKGLERALLAALRQGSYREEVHAAVLDALRERRAPGLRDVVLAESQPGHSRRIRMAAIRQMGELAQREPDERRRGEIVDRLIRLLDDDATRVRASAVDALVASKDARGIEPLKRVAASSWSTLTRGEAERGAEKLRKAAAESARVAELQGRLDDESKAREKLESRIQKLEARAGGRHDDDDAKAKAKAKAKGEDEDEDEADEPHGGHG